MRGGNLAVIWKRALAYIIDIFIVNSIIVSPLNKLLDFPGNLDITNLLSIFGNIGLLKSFFVIFLLSGIITILYWTVLEFKIQQTLGGFLLGIKVKSETRKINFLPFLIRNITKISFIILLIDSIYILYSKKKQRFTEKLSKTITIKNEK